ncbi:MAG: hypothetical protein ACI8RY_000450 [Urechidicola sp.]|jgi:hypothetical protein|tara:strand:+ start:1917 stop:2705 length:789 start_codon:yes stop_codon:yes gene_type:complete
MDFYFKKMNTKYDNGTVDYYLGEQQIHVNELIGNEVEFIYNGQINCTSCGKKTKTSFAQGFCYSCFINAPQASPCIIKPELCEAHLGKGRNVEWEEKYHNVPHYVYLAISSAVKVGITNGQNLPYRWIDQGASSGIILAEVPYRRLAGDIEVALKEKFTDKTNWRKMLTNDILEGVDLEEVKWELEETLPSDLSQYLSENDDITEINYPVLKYPTKVTSVNLEKIPKFRKKLMGIKGQYFIFDDNTVINIRKYTGHHIQLNF